jgi:hypothetical protein
MTAGGPPDGPAGASTLLDVLAEASAAGYGSQLIVTDGGQVHCPVCDTTQAVRDVEVAGFRRLEGASDPADMLLVTWGTCSGCGRGGVATLGYGPNASEGDVAALAQLDLDEPG